LVSAAAKTNSEFISMFVDPMGIEKFLQPGRAEETCPGSSRSVQLNHRGRAASVAATNPAKSGLQQSKGVTCSPTPPHSWQQNLVHKTVWKK